MLLQGEEGIARARLRCQKRGTYLPFINNKASHDKLLGFMIKNNLHEVFAGISYNWEMNKFLETRTLKTAANIHFQQVFDDYNNSPKTWQDLLTKTQRPSYEVHIWGILRVQKRSWTPEPLGHIWVQFVQGSCSSKQNNEKTRCLYQQPHRYQRKRKHTNIQRKV